MIEAISQLIAQFGAITGTGYTPPKCYLSECQAREWLSAGFTLEDLKLLVKYRRQKMEEPFLGNMLKWSFLIGRLDRFSEDLSQAKAAFRNHCKPPTNKERVLEATGRANHCGETNKMAVGRTAGQVMSEAGLKAFEDFKREAERLRNS